MMLRNRTALSTKTNLPQQQTNGHVKAVDPPAKCIQRAASKQIAPAKEDINVLEPKAKRAALNELTTKLSNGLVLDSVRKGLGIRKTEKLAPKAEPEDILEDELEEEKKEDPCPDYDYDSENKKDPYNVPEFAFDIFVYYRKRESAYAVGDYLKKQSKLSMGARAILVDWMVQETFELNHETLYLAVKLVDTYLHRTTKKVKPEELQLIASAAVFIASKYEERSPPLIDDFIYLSQDSFKKEALEEAEREVFRIVNFDLGAPLSYSHLRRYAKACKVDMQGLTLARYILETSLMFYEFVSASESKMAAGAFLLALKMVDEKAQWTPVMHKYSGYSAEEVEPWTWALNHMLHIRKSGGGKYSKQHTVADKYSHEIFFKSSEVPLLADKFRLASPLVCPK
ncbi:hypothetical protein PRIPAC_74538 [Pristionchus pacificus]|uniref:G2/mitotic-specific cyclin-B3 n=1 Tax=Pristionchus pacificus TaxID=54126 RepID=A0A2A6BG22_PRIPA|nr:hypothetical protein PRIPAC_74538 [Pristionchus pacificus]|eukprot:PDM64830.1 cyb-3 [Pristionchus pacificus]